MLVDSHCHLNYKGLVEEQDAVIKRARDAGIVMMQNICTTLKEFPAILDTAKKYNDIYCSVGTHPHETEEEEEITPEILIDLANSHDKIIGIGETGLDYFYDHSDRGIQRKYFMDHIYASAVTKKPIIVHSRSADDDTIDLLSQGMKEKEYPGLIHCFSSTKELAQKSLDLGLYISIAGIVTFKKAEELQEIVKYLPLDRMLIETDSPYLAPIPHRGKTNEPSYVRYVAEKIADLKGISFKEVAEVTTKNFHELFFPASS